jgi:hypothetical protein
LSNILDLQFVRISSALPSILGISAREKGDYDDRSHRPRCAGIERSAAFYDAALGALGMCRVAQLPDDAGIGGIGYGYDDYSVFWVDRYHPHSVR